MKMDMFIEGVGRRASGIRKSPLARICLTPDARRPPDA